MLNNSGEELPEYDETTCITAGELRAVGYPIPDDIPDCGWIPRSAMKLDAVKSSELPSDSATLNLALKVTFTESFRWISLTATITKDGELQF